MCCCITGSGPSGATNRNSVGPIEADNIICKVIACMPFIGFAAYCVSVNSLDVDLAKTVDRSRTIKLVEVRNHYKIATIIQTVILIAMIATFMATGILRAAAADLSIGGVCMGVLVGAAAYNVYLIRCNHKLIDEITSTGTRKGMEFR